MGWVYNASAAVNAQSNYPTILGVSISLVVLMAIVVCLRFYLRGLVLNVVGADDWVIGAGAVSQIPPRPLRKVFAWESADLYLLPRSAASRTTS